jgi:hypothetical protein
VTTSDKLAAVSAAVPRGLGMWIMSLRHPTIGTPEQAAAKAKGAGLSFVSILACWQEGPGKHGNVNVHELPEYAAAFREAGIFPGVWGYPWGRPDMIPRFVERMHQAVGDGRAPWLIIDPEKGFRGQVIGPHAPALLEELVRRIFDEVLREDVGFGTSTWPLLSGMRDFPTAAVAGRGFGCPQTYQVPLEQARRAVEMWRQLGWVDLVPALPTFGRQTEAEDGEPDSAGDADLKLIAYASAILERARVLDQDHEVAGCFWQWPKTSAREWRAIQVLSQRHELLAEVI